MSDEASLQTTTSPTMPQRMMNVIKRSPISRPSMFRAYNHLLKRVNEQPLAQTYFGATIRCHLDDMISRTIFYFGFWEPNNSAVFEQVLKPGDLFVDVGANIGYYSLLASHLVGPEGRVISIEAAPRIYAQLEDNIETNRASNARLINMAVSDRQGSLNIYGGTKWNRGSTSTIKRNDEHVLEATVAAAPLDEMLTPDELARVALIKIDIEGAELPVLQRLISTLDRYSPSMCVMVEIAQDAGSASQEIFDRFLAAGFEIYAIENEYDMDWYMNWRRPAALQKLTHLPNRQVDVLLARPAEIARQRTTASLRANSVS
jgi:FkbM family methyltransferase